MLTEHQAAEMLNVPRPYLVKLLEGEEMPYTVVHNRRKILEKDLLAYKGVRDDKRRQLLQKFSDAIDEDDLDDP